MQRDRLNDLLTAFSEEIRLRILLLLGKKSSLCVKCIVGVIDAPQPTISRHLSILRKSGAVRVKKDEQHRYYSLNKEDEFSGLNTGLLEVFQRSLKNKIPFNKDSAKLKQILAGCSVDCKVDK